MVPQVAAPLLPSGLEALVDLLLPGLPFAVDPPQDSAPQALAPVAASDSLAPPPPFLWKFLFLALAWRHPDGETWSETFPLPVATATTHPVDGYSFLLSLSGLFALLPFKSGLYKFFQNPGLIEYLGKLQVSQAHVWPSRKSRARSDQVRGNPAAADFDFQQWMGTALLSVALLGYCLRAKTAPSELQEKVLEILGAILCQLAQPVVLALLPGVEVAFTALAGHSGLFAPGALVRDALDRLDVLRLWASLSSVELAPLHGPVPLHHLVWCMCRCCSFAPNGIRLSRRVVHLVAQALELAFASRPLLLRESPGCEKLPPECSHALRQWQIGRAHV